MTEKLSPNFLNELFRTAFRNKNVFEILLEHLEYHYLPTEEYKSVWKSAKTHYEVFNELPTIGSIGEKNKQNVKILTQLTQIKDADIVSQDVLLKQLETYLKDTKFVSLYDSIDSLYKAGNKEKAITEFQKISTEIVNFSLQAQTFESVFKGFEPRYNARIVANSIKTQGESKMVFGIDCLDSRTRGGIDKGKTCLITARSGIGKSKILKWIAYSNARLGKKILHFQFEGSKEECVLAYEAMIAGSSYYDMKTTSLDNERIKLAIEGSNKVTGDIHVIAYEQFGSATMVDVRNSVVEYIKQNGNPDGIILDYLDEAEPGDGLRYSPNAEGIKAKKRKVAGLFTNLCVEFNMSGAIATQASDVPVQVWNNPKEVMTRSNIKGDKNLVDPFSFHYTLNQTMDEKKDNVMRLYEDKHRDWPDGNTHMICTAFNYEKFYDRKRTINIFGEK